MNKKPEKTNKAASPKEALTAIKKVTKRFLDREDNYLDQQRQVLFVFYALFLSCGLLTNITGLSGTFHPFYTTMNSIMLAEIVVLSVAYITRRLSIVKTIGCMTLSLQLCLAVETVFGALSPDIKDDVTMILINMLILSANTIFSLATYLILTSRLTTAIALCTYIVCLTATGNRILHDYFLILLLIMLFISAIGIRIAKNAEYLVQANKTLQRDETELLQVLRLNKKQVKAYIALALEKHDLAKTTHLLNLMGATSQKNVIDNVTEFLKQQELEKHDIASVFPDFTPSELNICRLILQGKKQGEICNILNKSESNISTQRANIRKKLGLQTSQDLAEALAERMNKG